jgi:WD40 repeat protein
MNPMSDLKSELAEWERFLTAKAYILNEKPWLLFQQAANHTEDSSFARRALERLDSGLEQRPWLRWINKSTVRDRCLATLAGHSGVRDCAFSSDATRIVSASEDGSLKVWKTSGQQVLSLVGHTDVASTCDFSPDGNLIVSGSWDGTIRLWDAHTGTEIALLTTDAGKPHRTLFSPSGDFVLATSLDGPFRAWNTRTLVELSEFSCQLPAPVSAFDLSADERSLLMFDGTSLSLWDVATGKWITGAQAAIQQVSTCSLSPDLSRAVCSGSGYSPRVFDLKTGDELRSLEGHTDACYECSFSPDGRLIMTASTDTTIRLWDAESLALVAVLSGHAGEVWRYRFARNQSIAVSAAGDGLLKVWDLAAIDSKEESVEMRSPLHVCEFSPAGDVLVTASRVELAVRDANSGKRIAGGDGGYQNWFGCEFSPSREYLACTDDTAQIQLFDAATCQLLPEESVPTGAICAVSRDWSLAASWVDSKKITIWDLNPIARRSAVSLSGSRSWFRRQPPCFFSPDGGRFFVADDRTVKVFDVATGAELSTWQPFEHEVSVCKLSPSGDRVISGTTEGELRLCDFNGRPLVSSSLDGWHARDFSPDGRYFAASENRKVTVRDIVNDAGVVSEIVHSEAVKMIVFSYGSDRVFTVSGNSLIRCLDVPTGDQLFSLKRNRYVVSLSLTPDDSLAILGLESGPIEFIGVASGKEVAAFWPAGGPVTLNWNPSLSRFAVGTISGDLYLLEPQRLN